MAGISAYPGQMLLITAPSTYSTTPSYSSNSSYDDSGNLQLALWLGLGIPLGLGLLGLVLGCRTMNKASVERASASQETPMAVSAPAPTPTSTHSITIPTNMALSSTTTNINTAPLSPYQTKPGGLPASVLERFGTFKYSAPNKAAAGQSQHHATQTQTPLGMDDLHGVKDVELMAMSVDVVCNIESGKDDIKTSEAEGREREDAVDREIGSKREDDVNPGIQITVTAADTSDQAIGGNGAVSAVDVGKDGVKFSTSPASERFSPPGPGQPEEFEGAAHGCHICLEPYVASEHLMVLPCAHTFHKDCALAWLQGSSNCPFCRMSLLEWAQSEGLDISGS